MGFSLASDAQGLFPTGLDALSAGQYLMTDYDTLPIYPTEYGYKLLFIRCTRTRSIRGTNRLRPIIELSHPLIRPLAEQSKVIVDNPNALPNKPTDYRSLELLDKPIVREPNEQVT